MCLTANNLARQRLDACLRRRDQLRDAIGKAIWRGHDYLLPHLRIEAKETQDDIDFLTNQLHDDDNDNDKTTHS